MPRKIFFKKCGVVDIAVRNLSLSPAGFEPAPPKRTDLKSVALDHSAIETDNRKHGFFLKIREVIAVCFLKFTATGNRTPVT